MQPDDLAEDLISAIHRHSGGAPIQPDDIDALAEFTITFLDQRGLLAISDQPPVLFLLTDRWHAKDRRHGLHATLTNAKIAARIVVASRGRAANAGDEWRVTADDDGNMCHKWAPVQLGSPVGDFTIHEMRVRRCRRD